LIDPSVAAADRLTLLSLLPALPPNVAQAFLAAGVTIRVIDAGAGPRFCRDESRDGGPGVHAIGGAEACFISPPGSAEKRPPPYLVIDIVTAPKDADAGLSNADIRRRTLQQTLIAAATDAYFNVLLEPALVPKIPAEDGIELQAAKVALTAAVTDAFASTHAAQGFIQTYGPGWAARPEAASRLIDLVTDWFYCSPAARAALKATYPAVDAAFAAGFQCVLGRPWYAAEGKDGGDFDKSCPGS
jgi:hypothetical protein